MNWQDTVKPTVQAVCSVSRKPTFRRANDVRISRVAGISPAYYANRRRDKETVRRRPTLIDLHNDAEKSTRTIAVIKMQDRNRKETQRVLRFYCML